MQNDLTVVDRATRLDDLETAAGDLVAEYWSPDAGESKRLVFVGIEQQMVPDFNDRNKNVPLECVIFLAQMPGGTWRRLCNGSKRLVATFSTNEIPTNTAYEITYHGEEKNRTNNNKSGRWSVVPLQAKVEGE